MFSLVRGVNIKDRAVSHTLCFPDFNMQLVIICIVDENYVFTVCPVCYEFEGGKSKEGTAYFCW